MFPLSFWFGTRLPVRTTTQDSFRCIVPPTRSRRVNDFISFFTKRGELCNSGVPGIIATRPFIDDSSTFRIFVKMTHAPAVFFPLP